MTKLYVLEPSDYKADAGFSVATTSDLIAAIQANESVRAEVLDGLGHREEVEQRVVASWKASAEAAEAKVAELTQERDDYRDGALAEARRCDELLAERNLARNETLAALEKVEELERQLFENGGLLARLAGRHENLERECQRLRGQVEALGGDDCSPGFGVDPEDSAALLKLREAIDAVDMWPSDAAKEAGEYEAAVAHMATQLREREKDDETFGGFLERILQPPPVPQAAETSVVRRCGNAWHTDCDLRWTHCFPLNPESAPAQGGREKVAGTPLTVEMMVGALRAGQLAWAKDDNVWDVIADELERAAKEESDG